jgi:hypothetical protein
MEKRFNLAMWLKILIIMVFAFAEATQISAQTADTVCYNTAPNAFISSTPASGGDSSFTYQWQDSISSGSWSAIAGTNSLTYQAPSLSQTTYYRRKVSSAFCGDAYSNPVQVMVLSALDTASTSITDVACNGGSAGAITISPSGGLAPYNYAWSNGASTANLSGLTAGTYTVTITDDFGCASLSLAFVVSQPNILATSVSTVSNVSCNGGNDGAISVASSGGVASYNYNWNNGSTSSSLTGLTAGTYTVTTTDANGCTSALSQSVTQPSGLTAIISSSSNLSCNGGNDGSVVASAAGGTATYGYAWNTGGSGTTITSLTAGTYSVTVTDANGCTDAISQTLTQPTSLSVSLAGTNISCNAGNDGSVTSSSSGGTAAYTYAWSNGSSTSSITALTAGNYSITVSDANGCTTTATQALTQPTALTVSISSSSNISCSSGNNGTITAAGTGGTATYSYLWSNSYSGATVSGLTAGNYTVTITDANGCTASSSQALTEPSALSTSITVSANVSCNASSDGSMTASTTGGTTSYSYLWNNGVTTATNSGLSAGNYIVTITDANGCTSTSSSAITEPTTLTSTVSVGNNVGCNGGSNAALTATGSGGTVSYTYLWSNGATSATNSGLSAGTYTITITDANSCTSTSSGTITEPAALTASISIDNNVSCNGLSDGALTATATGGTTNYSYIWSNAASTATIASLTAGNYSVTITDANGCTSTSNAVITQPSALSVSISVDQDVSCNGGNDGALTASGSGGTAVYSYAWSNGASSATASSLTAGIYTVTLTDANGCSATSSQAVAEPSVLSVSLSVVHVSCIGGNDGEVNSTPGGGTLPYSYLWSNSSTTQNINSLTAGTYTLTLTDDNGCSENDSGTVSQPAALSGGSITTGN